MRIRSLILFTLVPASLLRADPIQFNEALITEVVNEVEVIDEATMQKSPAKVEERFNAPNILQTGRRSRAQMTAEDGTVFRVGSNSVFSFDPDSRDMNLNRGSLLFNTPTGQGGGRVVTASASASVLGTTIIVVATSDGGFKVLCLEGTTEVTYPDGRVVRIDAGQLVFVLADSMMGPVMTFDLQRQTQGSKLLNGFGQGLPSLGAIESAIKKQKSEIEGGDLSETGQMIIDGVEQDGLTPMDPGSQAIAVNPWDNGIIEHLRPQELYYHHHEEDYYYEGGSTVTITPVTPVGAE